MKRKRSMVSKALSWVVCVAVLAAVSYGQQQGVEDSPVLLPVKQGGRWGYIDSTGQMAVEPQFDWAAEFSDTLARVGIADETAYIDKSGTVVFQCPWDSASDFSDGLALVGIPGKYGYLDKTGGTAIELQFPLAGRFSEGLAWVQIGKGSRRGKRLSDVLVGPVAPSTGEGAGPAGRFVAGGPRYGYIDKTGQVVIEPRFMSAGDFSEGLANVKIRGRYGYIDKTGEVVIKPDYHWA
ncbi:MAG: WG repeat-containing protein, partial [Planctomycetota bacterium]